MIVINYHVMLPKLFLVDRIGYRSIIHASIPQIYDYWIFEKEACSFCFIIMIIIIMIKMWFDIHSSRRFDCFARHQLYESTAFGVRYMLGT